MLKWKRNNLDAPHNYGCKWTKLFISNSGSTLKKEEDYTHLYIKWAKFRLKYKWAKLIHINLFVNNWIKSNKSNECNSSLDLWMNQFVHKYF